MAKNESVEIGEYKGNKVITLKRNAEDRFPFSFGIGKAKLIVEHFKAIKQFVEDNESEQ